MNIIELKTYPAPPLNHKEMLRYAGCKEPTAEVMALLEEALQELQNGCTYRVCSCRFSLQIQGDLCDFGAFSLRSKALAKNLCGCPEAVIFAATIGVEVDRLIGKNLRLSPAKAMLLDAIGTERIESLCDVFCAEWENTRPRFSPGYGDLPLESQKVLFSILDCQRKIGLCLNESLMMSPSKSVTAILGLEGDKE